MPTLIQSIFLAITQGITELLPISSSGHLLIVSHFFNIPLDQNLLTFLHFWTALAIFAYYFKTLIDLLKSKHGLKFYAFIILATIPAAIAGVLFDKYIEANFYTMGVIVFNLIFWGILMILIDRYYNRKVAVEQTELVESKPRNIFLMGLSQALAIIPGTSRSGITTMTGMLAGVKKEVALDIAFILGIPITLGPFLFEVAKKPSILHEFLSAQSLITGLVTFVAGYLAILLINRLKKSNFLTAFGWYRIAAGAIVILLLIVGAN